MRRRLFTTVAATTLLAVGSALPLLACEQSKNAATAAAKEAHAGCTPAQKAKGASAVTADASGKSGCRSKAATADAAACPAHGAIQTAVAKPVEGGYDAYAAGGSSCGSKETASKSAYSNIGCDACADVAMCNSELKAARSLTQVVKLKNGVMFVHTAVGASRVNAVQAAMTRRNDRLNSIAAAGHEAKLCGECKEMRGAMASGKLNREVVTIEGGALMLMTSSDPEIVAKLHSMVPEEQKKTAHKS